MGSEGIAVPILLLIFCAVMIVLAPLSERGARRQTRDALLELAAGELGGTLLREEPRAIRFTLRDRAAELRVSGGGAGSGSWTSLVVDVRGISPGTLTIFPETFWSRIGEAFGAQDLRVGKLDFDESYVVRARPKELAARFFSPERAARMVALVFRLGQWGGPVIDLSKERLCFRVGSLLEPQAGLQDLVRAAEEMLAALIEIEPVTEIIWFDETRPGGQCQVCGTEMTSGVVHCARCKTPHHEECWKYAGECSTFACRERRYLRDGRVFRPPDRGQTPEEWLREEVERDRREMARRE